MGKIVEKIREMKRDLAYSLSSAYERHYGEGLSEEDIQRYFERSKK